MNVKLRIPGPIMIILVALVPLLLGLAAYFIGNAIDSGYLTSLGEVIFVLYIVGGLVLLIFPGRWG